MNHVKASHTWKALTSSPQPDISSRRSDVHGKRTEYMVSQRWWSRPFSHRHLRAMIHGGVHKTRKLFIYGTQWMIKTDRILWRNSRQRADGRYGKQGTRNGHQHCTRWTSTSSSIFTKTSKVCSLRRTCRNHTIWKTSLTTRSRTFLSVSCNMLTYADV